jgi:hypothetical protein
MMKNLKFCLLALALLLSLPATVLVNASALWEQYVDEPSDGDVKSVASEAGEMVGEARTARELAGMLVNGVNGIPYSPAEISDSDLVTDDEIRLVRDNEDNFWGEYTRLNGGNPATRDVAMAIYNRIRALPKENINNEYLTGVPGMFEQAEAANEKAAAQRAQQAARAVANVGFTIADVMATVKPMKNNTSFSAGSQAVLRDYFNKAKAAGNKALATQILNYAASVKQPSLGVKVMAAELAAM